MKHEEKTAEEKRLEEAQEGKAPRTMSAW